ncbi:hypothetical protein LCGC14_2480900 [marine sediment metagenome]|uniref:Sulfotransferase domain-containing protein n=1 Tax=marine sediment metagenome TaxID=412755 RepID=A0A0F9BVC9_9ZZZZ
MKVIVLATVPHTGTWFMVEFLRTHPAVSNFVEIQVLQKAGNLPAGPERKGLVSDGVNLVQGHFGPLPHQKLLLAFAALCPLIIPLRDPLLGLIGAKNRDRSGQSDSDGFGQLLIEAWLELARQIDAERDFYQPFYVPLDLLYLPLDTLTDRVNLKRLFMEHRTGFLVRCLDHCGWLSLYGRGLKNDQKGISHAQKWAEEWPHDKYNSRGMYPLKEAYMARDKKKIRDAMPKAYYSLEQAEGALRPMLEREGYRELMWWS